MGVTNQYEFELRAPQAGISRDLDAFDRRVAKSQAGWDRFRDDVRDIGKAISGLVRLNAELEKVRTNLKAMAGDAKSAGAAIEDVGKGNRSVTGLTERLEKLDVELKQKVIDANAAEAALARVGTGGPLGSGQGGGAGGGGGGGVAQHALLRGAVKKAMGTGLVVAGLATARAGQDARAKREFLQHASERTSKLRLDLKEYASLRGENAGPTDRIVDEVTSFAKETGASVDEAADFLTAYEGSAPTGRDKGNVGGARPGGKANAAQAELDRKVAVIAGQFGSAVGMDAKTAGDLAGVVGQYTKIQKPEDFARELGAMHYGLDKGRGAISTLARSELGTAGASIADDIKDGRVSGLGELGAWIGVTSSISKTGASSGTSYKQVGRLLNTMESKGGGEFLTKSGIRAKQGDTAKLNALADYLRDNKVGNASDFLGKQGFENSTDIAATVSMVTQRDVLNQRIAEGRKVTGRDVLDRNQLNQRSVSMGTQHSAVEEDVAIIEQGKRQEKVEIGRAQARAALIGRDKLKSTGMGGALQDMTFNWLTAGAETGEQVRVDTEMAQQLRERAKKVGIHDSTNKLSGIMLGSTWGGKDEEAFRAEYSKQYDRVVAAESAAEKIKQGGQLIIQGAQQMQQQGAQGGNGKGAGFVPGRR